MKSIIEKMRTDFVLVGEDRIQSGQWTEADYAEHGAAIKAVISAYQSDKDPAKATAAAVLQWARWLADLSAWVTAYRMICVPTNRCIEAHIQARRLESTTAANRQTVKPAAPANGSFHTNPSHG